MKLERVAIDLDYGKFKTLFILIKAFLFERFKWYSIEIRKSPSHFRKKKGYHLIIWFYGKVPVMKLRKYFYDDKNRMRIDRRHRLNKQFLFRDKKFYQVREKRNKEIYLKKIKI